MNPDGNLIALVVGKQIKLFDIANSKLEEFIKFPKEFKHTTMAWSPDGQWLYYANCYGEGRVELWRINTESRKEELLDKTFPHVKQLTMHPDGRRLAFTVGEMSGKSSIWVMKNFLNE